MSNVLERKKSFPLYYDYKNHFEMLSLEERGQLITDLINYASEGIIPDYAENQSINRVLAMAFSVMSIQIDRDNERYEETCEKNRANANKRWGNENEIKPDLYKIARREHPNGDYEEDEKGGLIIKSRGKEVGYVTPTGEYKYIFGGGITYHR